MKATRRLGPALAALSVFAGLASLALSEERTLAIAREAPGLALPDLSGNTGQVASLRQTGPVIVVFLPVLQNRSACQSEKETWARTRDALAALKMSLVAVTPAASKAACEGGFGPVPLLLDAQDGTPERTTALLDGDGVVRWLQRSESLPLQAEELLAGVTLWDLGRVTFEVDCGHCHGSDGLDTSYPGVKSMAGITKRMDRETLFRRAQEAGAVDLSRRRPKDRDGLYLFLAGL